ncbi:MAG: YidB family protein [Geobacteraceae bacterium]
MGLLDEIVSKVSGVMGQGEGEQSGLLDGVMQLLGSKESGGLAGLVQSFQGNGLGGIISSWIGTGENQPISAGQLQQVLGSDAIQGIAAKAGIAPEEIAGKLAEFLPGVIDKLTPDGTLPEGGLLEKGMEILKGKVS